METNAKIRTRRYRLLLLLLKLLRSLAIKIFILLRLEQGELLKSAKLKWRMELCSIRQKVCLSRFAKVYLLYSHKL